jgi:hypothetical protein
MAVSFCLPSISFMTVDFFSMPQNPARGRRLYSPSDRSLVAICITLNNPSPSPVFGPCGKHGSHWTTEGD